MTCDDDAHEAWYFRWEGRFKRLSFPGVQRVIRRQRSAAAAEDAIPGLPQPGPLLPCAIRLLPPNSSMGMWHADRRLENPILWCMTKLANF